MKPDYIPKWIQSISRKLLGIFFLTLTVAIINNTLLNIQKNKSTINYKEVKENKRIKKIETRIDSIENTVLKQGNILVTGLIVHICLNFL